MSNILNTMSVVPTSPTLAKSGPLFSSLPPLFVLPESCPLPPLLSSQVAYRHAQTEGLTKCHRRKDNHRPKGRAFKPKNTTRGSNNYQLRQYAEATLGAGSLKQAVKLPEGEDTCEWIAVNGGSIPFHIGGQEVRGAEEWVGCMV